MRLAAVDPGEKRVGIAVSDELGIVARALATVEGRTPEQRADAVASAFAGLDIERVLVGLPRNMDGSEGPSAAAARAFATLLRARVTSPVDLVDERLTTVGASRLLREGGRDARKQKGRIDAASAVVLLQSHLDSRP